MPRTNVTTKSSNGHPHHGIMEDSVATGAVTAGSVDAIDEPDMENNNAITSSNIKNLM
jgi:hypothetical protein